AIRPAWSGLTGSGSTRSGSTRSGSSVYASHDRVDTGERDHHIGDHAAFGHHRSSLQVHKGRIAEVRAVRSRAAIGDDMTCDLAARRLDGHIRLPGGHPESLGDDLEMVNKGFHGLAHNVFDVLGRVRSEEHT